MQETKNIKNTEHSQSR